MASDNIGRLEQVGLVRKGVPIPQEYREVLEGLSEAEINTLIAVRLRLDAVGADADVQGHAATDAEDLAFLGAA